jgi:hypothetical protein
MFNFATSQPHRPSRTRSAPDVTQPPLHFRQAEKSILSVSIRFLKTGEGIVFRYQEEKEKQLEHHTGGQLNDYRKDGYGHRPARIARRKVGV